MTAKKPEEVPEWKKKHVEEVKEMLEQPVSGLIELKGLPSTQFQEIKKKLRGQAQIKVTRKTLIERAIKKAKKENIEKLKEHLEGPIGVISSEKDPFILYKTLKNNKSKSKAKTGKEVEKDIVIKKGPTSLQPGPVLGDLQKVGLPAQIEGPKIVIKKDKVLLKKGEKITGDIAGALNTLGMKPLEIGINTKILLENGQLYTPEQLNIDEEAFMNQLTLAAQQAVNLSVEAGYPTKQSIEIMIAKAGQHALNLALEANIITKETIELEVNKAGAQANSLYTLLKNKGYEQNPKKDEDQEDKGG